MMESWGDGFAVDVVGTVAIKGFWGLTGGGLGKAARKVGSRLRAPDDAAFRKDFALFWIPGEAELETPVLWVGTGVCRVWMGGTTGAWADGGLTKVL